MISVEMHQRPEKSKGRNVLVLSCDSTQDKCFLEKVGKRDAGRENWGVDAKGEFMSLFFGGNLAGCPTSKLKASGQSQRPCSCRHTFNASAINSISTTAGCRTFSSPIKED